MTAASAVSDTTQNSQPPGSASPCSSQAPAILSIDAAPLVSEAVPPDLVPVQDPDFTSESLPFLMTTSGTVSLSSAPTPSPSESSGDPETKRVAPLKRRSTDPPTAAVTSKPSKKQKKDKGKHPGSDVGSGSGQRTLAAFFAPQPSQSQPPSQLLPQSQSQRQPPSASQTEWNTSRDQPLLSSDSDLATDYQLALRLASSQEAEPLPLISSTGNGSCSNSKAAWSQLMAPVQPPKCTVHGEPAKEYTVNKPGPNKGKTFFICSRYVIAIRLGDPVTSLTDAQSDLFPDLISSGPVTKRRPRM
jgi:AP endonuclease-2